MIQTRKRETIERLLIGSWDFNVVAYGAQGGRHKPVLLLHGVHSNTATMWRTATSFAAAGYATFVPDLPGHGRTRRSGGPTQESLLEAFSTPAIGAAVAQLAADLGLRAPLIVGHSWGASVALEAVRTGLEARAVVLVEPPHVSPAETGRLADLLSSELCDTFEAALGVVAEWEIPHPADMAAKALALTQVDEPTVRAIFTAGPGWDLVASLRRLTPELRERVWVVCGESQSGGYLTPEIISGVRIELASSRVVELAGVGYWPQWEAFDEYMRALFAVAGDHVDTGERLPT